MISYPHPRRRDGEEKFSSLYVCAGCKHPNIVPEPFRDLTIFNVWRASCTHKYECLVPFFWGFPFSCFRLFLRSMNVCCNRCSSFLNISVFVSRSNGQLFLED